MGEVPACVLHDRPARKAPSPRVVLPLWPAGARCQTGSGSVVGSVSDSSGTLLVGAEVRGLTVELTTRTDEQGQFRLAPLPLGALLLEARRLGFRPETLHVAI